MGAVFPALRVPPAPNSQRGECGGTPPVTELVKETVRGMVPSFGEAVISTTRGGGGGGGVGVTLTVAVWFPVNPPVSFASRVTLYVPGTANWCCAVASLDHGVSQVPSLSQSHRTWSRFGGSWASNEVEVNVKTMDVAPLAGVQLKFAYGGMFVGGGGGGGVKGTFTLANSDGVPPVSKACASNLLTPDNKVTPSVPTSKPAAGLHAPSGAPIVGPEVAAVRIAIVPCVGIRRRIVRLRATAVVVGKRVPECPDALRVVDLEALGDVVREPVVGDVGVERAVQTQSGAFVRLEGIVSDRQGVSQPDAVRPHVRRNPVADDRQVRDGLETGRGPDGALDVAVSEHHVLRIGDDDARRDPVQPVGRQCHGGHARDPDGDTIVNQCAVRDGHILGGMIDEEAGSLIPGEIGERDGHVATARDVYPAPFRRD